MNSWLDTIVIFTFAILYPIYGLLTYPIAKLELLLRQSPAALRRRLYLETMIWEWLLAGFAIYAWIQGNRSLADLGLKIPSGPRFLLGATLVFASITYMLWQMQQVRQLPSARQLVRSQVTTYSQTLPRSQGELFLFLLVSITAGFCEELLYRGFLIPYIEAFSNKGVAILLSSVLFGLCHAYYQGWYGALRTGGMGVVFAGLYIFSGSLWLSILLHAFMDFNGARIVHAAFQESATESSS